MSLDYISYGALSTSPFASGSQWFAMDLYVLLLEESSASWEKSLLADLSMPVKFAMAQTHRGVYRYYYGDPLV